MEGNRRHVSMTPELVVVWWSDSVLFSPPLRPSHSLCSRLGTTPSESSSKARFPSFPFSLLLSVFLSLSFCAQRPKQFEGHLARDSASPRDERRNSSEGRLTAWHWRPQWDREASQKLCLNELDPVRSSLASLRIWDASTRRATWQRRDLFPGFHASSSEPTD